MDPGAPRMRSTGRLDHEGDGFFVYSAVLGSTPDTNFASVYGDTEGSKVPHLTGSHELDFWAA